MMSIALCILIKIMSRLFSVIFREMAVALCFLIVVPTVMNAQTTKKSKSAQMQEIPHTVEDQTQDQTETQSIENKPTEFELLLDKELNNAGQTQGVKENEGTNWFIQILKTILGLVFVIFIIFLFRKFLNYKKSFIGNTGGVIKTLHEYSVESGKKLQIIEIGNKLLLIGVSDAGIQLISEFKEPVFIDQIKLNCEAVGRTETPDMWLDLTNAITNKIKDLMKKKDHENIVKDDYKWENLQANARSKVQELREKKKLFEDLDDFDEK